MSRTWATPGFLVVVRQPVDQLEKDWRYLHTLVSVEGGTSFVDLDRLFHFSGVQSRFRSENTDIVQTYTVTRGRKVFLYGRLVMCLMFLEPLAEGSGCFAYVGIIARVAVDVIHYSALVYCGRRVFWFDQKGPEGVARFVIDVDIMFFKDSLQLFR